MDCFFCQYQGAFGYIRGVIEISGFPASITYDISGDSETTTGLQGRNGVMKVNWPIIDGCPAATGFDNASAGTTSDFYDINVTRDFIAGHSRQEQKVISGGNFPVPFYVGVGFVNQNVVGDTIERIVSPIDSGVRSPAGTFNRDLLHLCSELLSGFSFVRPITTNTGIFLFNVTTVGYMEISLI